MDNLTYAVVNKNELSTTVITKKDIYSISYAVVAKDNITEVIRKFEDRAEANYYITDCYGPEASDYTIVELVTIEG